MHTSQKSYHTITFWKQNLFGWLGFSLSFGKDSDDEVVTEQLTAVVDVTFMPHGNKIVTRTKIETKV